MSNSRATVTNRDHARVKRAILPAATVDLHDMETLPCDKATGLEK